MSLMIKEGNEAKIIFDISNVKNLIFIDDSIKNVDAMAIAAKTLGLNYKGIHYTNADTYKDKFNPVLGSRQANLLKENLSSKEIFKRLELLHIEKFG